MDVFFSVGRETEVFKWPIDMLLKLSFHFFCAMYKIFDRVVKGGVQGEGVP